MAKQNAKTIEKRKSEMKGLGFSDQEIIRPDILESIENTTAGNWPGVLEDFKKKKEDAAIPLTDAEHIPQEEQPTTMIAATMDPKKDIATFDVNEKIIGEWKKKYAHLEVAGLDDPNISLVKEGHKLIKGTRIRVEKREDFLKAPYIAGSKMIKAAADKYYLLLAEVEDPLKKQIAKIKELEDAEELKKKEEAEKEGNRRVDVLKEAGMTFDGQFYVIGETMSMDLSSVRAMPLEEFETFVGKVKKEKKRLDELEADRLKELKEQRRITRGDMLKSIGMAADATGIYASEHLEGVKVLPECLTDETDNKFMTLFSSLSGRIADAKQKAKDEADKKAKERTVSLRSKLILAIGMNKVDWIPGTTQTGFYFKNDFVECKLTMPEVEALSDDMFDATIEVNEKKIADAKTAAAKKEEDDTKARQRSLDRSQQLIAMGMTRAPQQNRFVFNLPNADTECFVDYEMMNSQTDEEWSGTITLGKDMIGKIREQQKAFEDKAAKDKKDKEEKEAKDLLVFQERQYKLVNLGLVIVGNSFTVKNEFGDNATITIEEVKALDEDVWPRRLMEMTQAVEDVKKKTEIKRGEALAHAEALKPQITRFREYLASFIDINAPEITEPELEAVMTVFKEDLGAAIIKANKALEQVNA